ncbi:hypothetical protein [Tepidibacter hydrothermalis]|uniref:Uncharacterized protein n=1 Tax=Tepidibacter hydrothermalis TaxID=3036126 RepID=A0ABY8EAK6_9FIRM|nr:hypothetical protein [Tepidibacter hydrothermalis]WFD09967.1 hypothetical protein P4S50_16555 [Tepidibacter hydrothermalis]
MNKFNSDCKTAMVDGKEEVVFTGRGAMLLVYFSWIDDKMPKAYESLKRYCQYLASHGYGNGATKILSELERKSKDEGADWIKSSYDEFVKNDNGLINYVLGL